MKQTRYWLAAHLGGALLDALFGTVRFRIAAPDPRVDGPVIYVLWHGRLLPLTYLHRGQGAMSLISRSADGEYIARVVERWGYLTARGSSSRGGSAALRELLKAARSGRSLAVTPDGPRGPRQKLKRGVLTAAQISGLPLVPVSCGTASGWWIEGWDRFLVPRPFAAVHVRYGAPIYVPRESSETELDALALQVESMLNTLTEQCDDDARN
jgi:lysophospholipid acyltransferase (LPLAT)-like uncharacterized protein